MHAPLYHVDPYTGYKTPVFAVRPIPEYIKARTRGCGYPPESLFQILVSWVTKHDVVWINVSRIDLKNIP